MARKRDYAKEYARQVERERKRADEERRAFELAKVRSKGGSKAAAKSPAKPPAKPPGKPPKRPSATPAPSPPRKGGRALKPLAELSPAVRKRIENYARKHGISPDSLESRKEARGHKEASEHAARKAAAEKADRTGVLSRGQKSALRAYYNSQIAARHGDWDEDEQAEQWSRFLAANQAIGWTQAVKAMRFQQTRLKDHKAKRIPPHSFFQADMEAAAASFGWDDWTWLWYK